jgi:uncharacterized protein YjdB
MARRRLPYPFLLVAAAMLQCCSNSNGYTGTNTGVAFVVVTEPNYSNTVAVGKTIQLTAQAYDQTDTQVFNVSFSWSSSDTTIASVDATGLVTGVAVGTATISARGGGEIGQTVVVVIAAAGDGG